MIVALCIDDNFGMMFNGRRQSQDRALRENLLAEARDSRLWMSPYSYQQFVSAPAKLKDKIFDDENFLDKAEEHDFCFVEERSLASCEERIEKIILYKWNRVYPADFYFDLAGKLITWRTVSTEFFIGTSHEKITKEVYER